MIFSFLFIYIFVVNIVYYVVHIVCQVDVIANSLVLYLPFCSTLNKNFFSLLFFSDGEHNYVRIIKKYTMYINSFNLTWCYIKTTSTFLCLLFNITIDIII